MNTTAQPATRTRTPQRPTAAQLRAVALFIHPAHGTAEWPALADCDAVGEWMLHLARQIDAAPPPEQPRDHLPGGARE
ncbi:MAG: hypothetical protein AB7P37_03370 [Ramlibacter sp.]